MNEIARKPLPHMTAEEFLAWPGDGTGRKFQLFDGEVRPMSPAAATHGSIQWNLAFLLNTAIRAAGLQLRGATEGAIVPGLNPALNVRIPDLVVTAARDARGVQIVASPVLLVEILSPSNQSDTRRNVEAYRTIGSAQEILIVHSTLLRVEIFRRDADGSWSAKPESVEAGQRLGLRSIGLDVAIEEVYAGTWLLEPPGR